VCAFSASRLQQVMIHSGYVPIGSRGSDVSVVVVPEVAFVRKHPFPTSVTPFTQKKIQKIYIYIMSLLYCSRAWRLYHTRSLGPPGYSAITVVFKDTIKREPSVGLIRNFTFSVILKPREKQHFVHTQLR
jgi:hypothetical protein